MKIILASKSGVRKDILNKYKIPVIVSPSNVDEDQVKESLLEKGAAPEIISKNLAELKSVKVSINIGDKKNEYLINKEFRPLKKPFSVGVEKFFSSEIKGLKKGKFIKVSFIPQNVVIKKHMKNAENIKYALNGI